MCNLAEITQNETVWRMRTNNVKRVYCQTKHDSSFNFLFKMVFESGLV